MKQKWILLIFSESWFNIEYQLLNPHFKKSGFLIDLLILILFGNFVHSEH